jgi:hypothetical protein
MGKWHGPYPTKLNTEKIAKARIYHAALRILISLSSPLRDRDSQMAELQLL